MSSSMAVLFLAIFVVSGTYGDDDYMPGLSAWKLGNLERRLTVLENNLKSGAIGGCESGVIGPFSPQHNTGVIRFRRKFVTSPSVQLALSDLTTFSQDSKVNDDPDVSNDFTLENNSTSNNGSGVNGSIVDNGSIDNNGSATDNGTIDNNGSTSSNVSIDNNGSTSNNGSADNNGSTPDNGSTNTDSNISFNIRHGFITTTSAWVFFTDNNKNIARASVSYMACPSNNNPVQNNNAYNRFPQRPAPRNNGFNNNAFNRFPKRPAPRNNRFNNGFNNRLNNGFNNRFNNGFLWGSLDD